MKFSLSNIALLILVCALALAFVVQRTETRILHAENMQLARSLGFAGVEGKEQFNMTTVGYRSTDTGFLHGSHLLRVMNYDSFQIEATKYQSSTNEQVTELIDINDPIIAISYVPFASTTKYFQIVSTYAANKKTNSQFNVSGVGNVVFAPWSHGGDVDDHCFLVYFFHTGTSFDIMPSTGMLSQHDVLKICDTHNVDATFFRLVKR